MAAAVVASQLPAALGSAGSSSNDNTLSIVEQDYSFAVHGALSAGTITIAVDNQGSEIHELAMFRLAEGYSIDDVTAALAAATDSDDPLSEMADDDETIDDLGGIQFPGTRYAITAAGVPAGDYAIVCNIPDGEGTRHFAHGMVAGFTIAPGNVTDVPDVDVTYTVTDDGLRGPATLPGGPTNIAVVNQSSVSREIHVLHLMDGKTWDDVGVWYGASGDAPPDPATSPLDFLAIVFDAEQDRIVSVDLAPGTWAVVASDPDNQGYALPDQDPFAVVVDVT